MLAERYRVAALVGDLATDNDAAAPGPQRRAGAADHHRHRLPPGGGDGRARPGGWELEDARLPVRRERRQPGLPRDVTTWARTCGWSLFSVTEGEDKPLKYPTIFNTADVAVITKMDLAAAVEFDRAAADANIQAVRPGMEVIRLSARTGEGMDEFLGLLERQLGRDPRRANGGQLAMNSLAVVVALGFFLGMRHATDPDHVIAVSTIVARFRRPRHAALIGGRVGIGHTLTILAVGGGIILLGWVIPARVWASRSNSPWA